ncbi:ethanolamine ammonia-lyase subunit EutB [Pelagibacterium halotolerans]|uniref:Ethanolamine ammonia-lyase large subunit n=1 Tax=Pelagibacterium halotolerans (strain DSM 22347 / JCM 15775 / CGMCC 1.7692 / B2) TaxID=1082931 RepID=G4RD53_PELHB|nr:ethanolamine ammonia-lyase subunit EutB [Pelagibacterium halotolerans]AEQ53803.1 ethanolamine ammonia-lyase heavy chain [Pelagibacterium halotolerans B2]QJR20041.1 ethanolamine ammonia-lyase subunit EutB [Pelagibacterium halotolerans]SEA81322.1 Ethanolamine ammonia-lyase heavy chain [Pelagibacterium halotolerans]
MGYSCSVGGTRWRFDDLRTLLAKATPLRSGDVLAGLAAQSELERVAARICLADLSLRDFLAAELMPEVEDEISALIAQQHDAQAFAPVSSLTVGEFREYLLGAEGEAIARLARGLTPEMAAAVSKLMRNIDLIAVSRKIRVITKFRTTLGLEGRLAARNQPNHPTDDPLGIAISAVDGLIHGSGDAVVGVNPATDGLEDYVRTARLLDDLRTHFSIPMQSCVLGHVTTALKAIAQNAPVDLVFQSIAGSQAANAAFGIDLAILREAQDAAQTLGRGTIGQDCMYFETGQGAALSSNGHHGVDQQTMEARAYALARAFDCLLVNTVVGFIGPEYLYDGKQIVRAGLEDHFCGKLLGLPMGCDVCYTNHAEADQNDMDVLLTALVTAGVTFVISVPGADDIMLNYQSLNHHDVALMRETASLRPAPEFEAWMVRMGLLDSQGRLAKANDRIQARLVRFGEKARA